MKKILEIHRIETGYFAKFFDPKLAPEKAYHDREGEKDVKLMLIDVIKAIDKSWEFTVIDSKTNARIVNGQNIF